MLRLLLATSGVHCSASRLSIVDTLLQHGNYADAIDLCNKIILDDDRDYVVKYKRSIAYNARGRTSAALADLEAALRLEPDFGAALALRGKIEASRGEWNKAISDLKASGAEEHELDAVIQAQIDAETATDAQARGDFDNCIDHASAALGLATAMPQLQITRGKCSLSKGDVEGAVGDYTVAAQLWHSTELYVDLASLLFFALHESPSNTLKACLHYDPDSKQCNALRSQIRKLDKEFNKAQDALDQSRWHAAVQILTKSGEGLVEQVRRDVRSLLYKNVITPKCKRILLAQVEEMACRAYFEMKTYDLARSHCEAARELNPDSVVALKAQAHHHIVMEEYDQAINILQRAYDLTQGHDQDIRAMLQQAQTLLKQSKNVDYYKILQVSRDADARTIKTAWRKMTYDFCRFRRIANFSRLYHPDKVKNTDKEAANKKYSEINRAYEVLSNAEMKAQYDNGNDPLDPGQGQPAHHQNPFGGGGQQFMFQQRSGGGPQFVFNQPPGGGGGQQFKWSFSF